jgi:hypothetical protein
LTLGARAEKMVMMTRRLFFLAIVAASAGTGLSAAGAASAAPVHPSAFPVVHGTSSHWAGYAAYGRSGTFSSVTATWTQPNVTCSSQDSYVAFWTGLDGYTTRTVEQIGTEGDCVSGQPTYYAWFEMYPRFGYTIDALDVVPGHSYTASVAVQRVATYALRLTDNTTGASYTTTQRMAGQNASAEVIVEAPSTFRSVLPLGNFGSVTFTGAQANGAPLGGQPNLDPITMVTSSGAKAVPGLFDGTRQNFSVAYRAF